MATQFCQGEKKKKKNTIMAKKAIVKMTDFIF